MILDPSHSYALTAEKVRSKDAASAVNWEQNTGVLSVNLRDQIKMAFAGVTIKVMPVSPDVDKKGVIEQVKIKIKEIYGDVGEIRIEEEPIAFGLVALKFTFVIDEKMGTDALENIEIDGVGNVSVIDFRRAIG